LGHWVWMLSRGKIVARDAQGHPQRMVGTKTDITPRKELEERMRHGEELSLQLGRLAQIGAWEWDLTAGRLTWSPEMFRIHEVDLGYEPTPEKALEFYPEYDRRTMSGALQHAIQKGTGFDLELPFLTAQGRRLWVRVLGRTEVHEGVATRIYGAFQDITGRRDAEDTRRHLEGQLFQAQKMETLGTLAGGIAHDFNNLLTGILGYQDLALDTLPEGDAARGYLSAARDASMRARELVEQILTFSRQAGSEKVPVSLAQVVDDARRFLRATVPSTIRIEAEVAPGCERVLADATQIHQVLLNLGSNAAYAMRATGGVMRLALRPVRLEEETAAALNHLPAGRYIRLDFSDTGMGMADDVRKRIFDPFFTTKEVGQGTGLGLSVVHGIIQAHHGAITVSSAPGQGAVFTVHLPVAPEAVDDFETVTAAVPRGGGELIAVVDDEDIVRSFAQMALEKMGYRVAAFDSPNQCLEVLRRAQGEYALLLTDQTMPMMKGIELAAEARLVAPTLPVVIMSGYFSRISPDKLAQIGQVALLSKPFTNEELARCIHRALHPDATVAS
ncbi:MAG: ATP-binding protein, partial [Opitutales bacterium]